MTSMNTYSYNQFTQTAAFQNDQVVSVHEAVAFCAKEVKRLPSLTIRGEISGFRGPNARSGHCYFQLKDELSSVDAIIWRGLFQKLDFPLRDGVQVEMSGSFNIYEASGKLSFVATSVRVAGEGLLRQQVAELARKLQAEGLMDESRKRPIPVFCNTIAVVTSLSGAVINDVLRTLARRNPLVRVIEVGCKVQGADAAPSIIEALEQAAHMHPDAILLVRGGGSFEDLMVFNDEQVARAVAASPVPVITGIGHEPDTSICDMVSDRRASTPTAAAESVAPAINELVSKLQAQAKQLQAAALQQVSGSDTGLTYQAQRLNQAMSHNLATAQSFVLKYVGRPCLTNPAYLYETRVMQLEQTKERLLDALPQFMEHKHTVLQNSTVHLNHLAQHLLDTPRSLIAKDAASLEALSPLKVLTRGYSLTQDAEGHVLGSVVEFSPHQRITIKLVDGSVDAEVCKVTPS